MSKETVCSLPFCPPTYRDSSLSQTPTALSGRPVFTLKGHTTAAGWAGVLEMALPITIYPRSRHQQRLNIKVGGIIYKRALAKVTKSHISLLHEVSRKMNLSLTFFHSACRHGFTVRTLELIEIWPHFNLIDDAFLQTGKSYVPLRGDLQVLHLPRPRGGQP